MSETTEKVILEDYQFDFLFFSQYSLIQQNLIKKIKDEAKKRNKETTKESERIYNLVSDASKSIYSATNILFKDYTPDMINDLENRCGGIEELNEYYFCMNDEYRQKLDLKSKEYYNTCHTNVISERLKQFAEKYRLSDKAIDELKEIF